VSQVLQVLGYKIREPSAVASIRRYPVTERATRNWLPRRAQILFGNRRPDTQRSKLASRRSLFQIPPIFLAHPTISATRHEAIQTLDDRGTLRVCGAISSAPGRVDIYSARVWGRADDERIVGVQDSLYLGLHQRI